jgi:glycine/D-amino acid oxidase-like deaminating enzyme
LNTENLKLTPFWTDDFPRPADLPVSPLPEQVDVAIIGGGYTGLSAAYTLAKGGASVAVLEQNQIGSGASSVNGGQATGGLKEGPQSLIKHYGRELGYELWASSLKAIRYTEQLIRDETIDCDYVSKGSIALAYRASHYDQLVRSAEWKARELDYHTILIPRDKLRTEIGSDVYFGGMLDENIGGGLHPAKFVYGLARAAACAGALLCEQTQVQSISRRPGHDGFRLVTSQGEVSADAVLIATNGYTEALVPELRRRVLPIGSYMITTEPLPAELQQDISPNQRVFWDTKWFLNYFRLTPDGRMAMGGRNDLSTSLDLLDSAHRLHRRTLDIFPQLRGIPITHSWTGRLGVTFDLLPHIGQVEGIYYAFGYSGHGVAIATYLGREVAQLISGQISRSPYAEIHHPTYFFYRRSPWFLPLVEAYFRVIDAIW